MINVSPRPGRVRRGSAGVCFGAAATLLVAMSGCGESATEPVADDPTPPVFSTPVIDLLSLREFIPFGIPDDPRTSSWEMITSGTDHDVRAVSEGRVIAILVNPLGGSQIHVQPTPGSIWTVIYDHVSGALVVVGDEVVPGTLLGATSVRTPTTGRVELQVILTGEPAVAHCPVDFGTEAFNAAHEAALEMTGSPHPAVCLADTATP